MEKKMNNKGFSLVELIIVVAIMAVLIGVLAPTYLKYVENSKRTSDCSAIGSILDACEVVAIDPSSDWASSTALTITVGVNNGKPYVEVENKEDLEFDGKVCEIIGTTPGTKIDLQASWDGATITATKAVNGTVSFTTTEADNDVEWDQTGASFYDQIQEFAPTLAGRITAGTAAPEGGEGGGEEPAGE